MITRPEEHDIDRAGKRLLRAALEKLGWILNDVEEDYGIDSNVQVLDGVQARIEPRSPGWHRRQRLCERNEL